MARSKVAPRFTTTAEPLAIRSALASVSVPALTVVEPV